MVKHNLDIFNCDQNGNNIITAKAASIGKCQFVLMLFRNHIFNHKELTGTNSQNILHQLFSNKDQWESDLSKRSYLVKSDLYDIVHLITLLKAKDFDFNQKDSNGKTPLDYIRSLNQPLIYKSYKKGLREAFKSKDFFEETITFSRSTSQITLAIQYDKKELLDRFIQNGADIEICNKWKQTPLLCGARRFGIGRKSRTLMHFIKKHKPNLLVKDHVGSTILHIIAESSDFNISEMKYIVERSVKAGLDINIKDNFNRTPLFNSLFANNKKAFFALIEYGADLNLKTGEKDLHPIYYVRDMDIWNFYLNHITIDEDMLEDIYYRRFSLYFPVKWDYEPILKYFESMGFDAQYVFKDGNTPLHLIAKHQLGICGSELIVIDYLLSRRANINALDHENNSVAMILTKRYSTSSILEFLEKYHSLIDFHHVNDQKQNMAHYLIQNNNLEPNDDKELEKYRYQNFKRIFKIIRANKVKTDFDEEFKSKYHEQISTLERLVGKITDDNDLLALTKS
jgi:ankyrin repeat protein